MDQTAISVLSWLTVILVGLAALFFTIILIGLIVMLVSNIVSSIVKDWRREPEE